MTQIQTPIRVMFVCLGNICRSPLAEGLFRKHVEKAGVSNYFEIASSGTGDWHVGKQADARMRTTAKRRGLSIESHKAQQFIEDHLQEYDHIYVMDKSNLHDVLFLDVEEAYGSRVRLFREFDPEPGDYQVPDPYYGGDEGFGEVYEIVDRTAKNILNAFMGHYDLRAAS